MKPRDNYEQEMDMPVPCQSCGRWFDLNDGCGSDKWYLNTVICERCSALEEQEIQLDDELEECTNAIEDAEYTIKERSKDKTELQEKIQKLQDKIDKWRDEE